MLGIVDNFLLARIGFVVHSLSLSSNEKLRLFVNDTDSGGHLWLLRIYACIYLKHFKE